MDAFSVPGDVLDALEAAGYRPVAAAGAAAWVAEPLSGQGARIELHVAAVVLDEAARQRADALIAVRHEHLPAVEAVVPLAPGRAGIVVEHVTGLTLSELRASRAPLCDGEAVTVTVPLVEALAALHAAGLQHGCVRSDCVVLRPDGRPVLTDVRGALLGVGSPDEDMRRLLAAVLDVMPGTDVELLAPGEGGPSLRHVLEELLVAPGIASDAVVDRCFGTATPVPVGLPDAGALASSDVSRAAGRVVRGDAAPVSRRSGRRPPRRRRLAAAVAVAALVLAGVVVAAHAEVGAPEGHAATAAGRVVPAATSVPVVPRGGAAAGAADRGAGDPSESPERAAERLTRARAAALAALDPGALTAVDAAGGPALSNDRALMASVGAVRLEGLGVTVSASSARAADGTSASVLVTSSMSGYVRVGQDGTRSVVASSPERTVVLELRRVDGDWRVWSVAAP